jgi:hypothetical protein
VSSRGLERRHAARWFQRGGSEERRRLDVGGRIPEEYETHFWNLACQEAALAERDPASLRRELRANLHPGQSLDDARKVGLAAQERGFTGVFYDFQHVKQSIDEALEATADLICGW